MLEISVYWVWAIIGIVLLIGELTTGTFYLLGISLGAFTVSIIDYFNPLSFKSQLLIFAIVAPIGILLSIKLLKKEKNRTLAGQSNDFSKDSVGNVIKNNSSSVGDIEFQMPIMGSKKWQFVSDQQLVEGDKAKVLSIEGNYLKVSKV
jgi:inner membrane protein